MAEKSLTAREAASEVLAGEHGMCCESVALMDPAVPGVWP